LAKAFCTADRVTAVPVYWFSI